MKRLRQFQLRFWSEAGARIVKAALAGPLAVAAIAAIVQVATGWRRDLVLWVGIPYVVAVIALEFVGLARMRQARQKEAAAAGDANGSTVDDQPEDAASIQENAKTVEAAFEFVIPSYGWLVSRYEAANGRIQNALGFESAFIFAALLLAGSIVESPDYTASTFIVGIVLAATSLLALFVSLTWGEIIVPNPAVFREHYLDQDETEFRRDQLEWAGVDFQDNRRAISIKHRGLMVGLMLFAASMGLLTSWASLEFVDSERLSPAAVSTDVKDP